MATIIRVENLSKKYAIGHRHAGSHATLRDEIAGRARALARRLRHPRSGRANGGVDFEEFWALRDVSFAVEEGERLGIIGRNGAGKSTLLKILSRITEPTGGRATIRGRLASLLEVGTGFHPELSGRENIYLNGAILGMGRAEIVRKFDEIVAFAEIERFLDTPVKRYSSGMYVRLAFAVAAHLDPEVLIVDEVLAVGDHRFQQKCLGKMEQVGKSGRTVVFVSHNMNAILGLCGRVIWIDEGRIVDDRDARGAVGEYLNQGAAGTTAWTPPAANDAPFAYQRVEVLAESAADNGGGLAADSPLQIVFDYTVNGDLPAGRLAFSLANEEGLVVLASSSTDGEPELNARWERGRATDRVVIGPHLLAPGRYFLTVSEPARNGDVIHERILSFRVSEVGSLVTRDGRRGAVAPLLHWSRQR